MATLQGKAVKNTYRQVLQIGANNVGVSGSLQPVQDGGGVNTSLSLSTTAATITGTLTINGDLIITGGGIQIQDLIDDTVASLIQNGTGITWAYNDTLRTLTPTITIATADGGVQGDFVQYNTGAGEANAVAKMYWNNTDGTVDLGLIGGNVVLPIGQKQVARVLNNSGSILNKSAYQVVKVSTAQGQRLAVILAQANNDANSTDTLGLVAENIANNQDGFITTSGVINGIDTTGDLQLEDWNDGDVLYLSPTTPGAITKVKPVAPQHTVIVGFVVYAHKNNGKIYVKVDNGYELDELHNVKITSVANDNILQYNSSLAVWENVAGTTTNIAEGTNLYYTQGRFDSAFAAKSTTNLAEGTNLYFTTARGDANFATNFATKDTDDLPEGSTNLYYTNTRTRNALSVTAGTGIAYNSTTGNFNLGSIPNASLTNSSVTINGLSLALGASITLTTSNIAEGTNLYWTDARFDSRFGTKTTTNLAEGTNLYYTQARFNTAFDAKTTTDLDEGTNLYYTDARSRAAFSENAVGLDYSSGSGILSLTAGYAIPTTVKLGQYDTAYNRSIVSAAVTGTSTKTLSLTQQDANVITASWTDQGITTINGTANQIAASTVGNTTTVGFTNDVTFPNNVVVSGNLTINGTATYVNTQSISSKDPLFEVANDNNTTDAVDIGYYGRYYDSAQTRVEFTGLFRDASDAGKFKFFTGLVDEPTNVVDTTGTGYTVGTLVANFEGNLAGTANAANALTTARTISATGDAAWSVSFDGTANATGALTLANTGVTATTYGTTTSVPTIAVDSKGRITSASNTNIAFPVLTVNSQSGNVVLTTSNVAEGTNQYFTTGRVAAYLTGAISTVLTTDLTASRAVASNASGKLVSSATTDTELGYLSGVTSAVQTQLNSKLNTSTAASTYLPLAGGTLTGTLNGTSATFSTNIGWGGQTPVGNPGVSNTIESLNGAQIAARINVPQLYISSNVSGTPFAPTRAVAGYAAQLSLDAFGGTMSLNRAVSGSAGSAITWISNLGFDVNGAATFSSSIRANAASTIYGATQDAIQTIFTLGGQNASAQAKELYFRLTASGTPQWTLQTASVGADSDINIYPSGANGLKIAYSGAASFTSSVTAGAILSTGVSTFSRTGLVFTLNPSYGGADVYTQLQSTGALALASGGDSNKLYISAGASWGVGIGTNSPVSTLDARGILSVGGAAGTYSVIQRSTTPSGSQGIILTAGTAKTEGGAGITFADNANSGGTIVLVGNSSDIYGGSVNLIAYGQTADSNIITFATRSGAGTTAERARITSGGNLLLATTTDIGYKMRIGGNGNAIWFDNSSASAQMFLSSTSNFYITTANSQGVVLNNGATSWSAYSDERLKNINSNIENALESLLTLRTVNYSWKSDDTNKENLGLIAQDIEKVFPQIIDKSKIHNSDDETEYLNVRYTELIPVLVKAIQELKAEIDELKAK